jgi:hypothetical protein
MKLFYNNNYQDNEEVRHAWYIFVLKFLPLVNKQWRDCTAPDKLKKKTSMFRSITISDEAIVQWFITLWVPLLEDRRKNDWVYSENKTGKGKHDIKVNSDSYTIIHMEIENARKDRDRAVRWNNIFWEEVEIRNRKMFEEQHEKKDTYKSTSAQYLPLPGLNEDQAYLASYTLDYDAAEALMNMSPSKRREV